METIEQKEKFIELRAKGYSFDKIAKELGRAKQTLIDWSKELEEEIANHKALELEALYEKYYLHKETRRQTFGELLGKIKKEIEKNILNELAVAKQLQIEGKEKDNSNLGKKVKEKEKSYSENRKIEDSLDLAWEILSKLPEEKLLRVSDELIEKYMRRFKNAPNKTDEI